MPDENQISKKDQETTRKSLEFLLERTVNVIVCKINSESGEVKYEDCEILSRGTGTLLNYEDRYFVLTRVIQKINFKSLRVSFVAV